MKIKGLCAVNAIPFIAVLVGDVFRTSAGTLCMKVRCPNNKFVAVRLCDGEFLEVALGSDVIPIDGEFVVSGD